MSRDVNDLLQRTADTPTRPLDTAAVVGRARRQTLFARAGAGLGAVAVVAIASLVALPMVTGDDPGLEIADGPDEVEEQLEDEAVWHPDDWVVLQAGELELSVPPEWEVRAVESAPEPSAQAGPCVSDLYGGIGSSEGAMTSPLAVVYPMETTGACRLIGLPDAPPERPSLVLYAGVSPPDGDAGPPQDGVQQHLGGVPMVRLESESAGHVARFQFRDGNAGLLVSHLDDPAVQQVLATLRHSAGREPTDDERAATSSSELWGRTFTSVAVTEGGVARALLDGTQIRLTFSTGSPVDDGSRPADGGETLVDPAADGYLTWDAGCNLGSSQLDVQDGRLTLDGYGHHTYKLCNDEQAEQDEWLNDFLRASPRWVLDGDQLMLSVDETRIVLESADQPDQTDNTDDPTERAPLAGSDTPSAVTPLMKAEGWRQELGPVTVRSTLEIAFDRQTAERAWQENTPAGLADVAGEPTAPGIYGTLNDVDFDTHAVAVWSARQWADCPNWVSDVEGNGTWLEVRREVAGAAGAIEGSPRQHCSGDMVPYRMLIAIDRDRLPDPDQLPTTDLTAVLVTGYPADLDQ